MTTKIKKTAATTHASKQALTRVLVNFIQDRSGSMSLVWTETLQGFTAFVEDLKKKGAADNIEYLFSLTVFDTLIEMPLVAKSIEDVHINELGKYPPRGMTALYDAVGKTIETTDKDRHGATKIVCVIVTDGQENSSREWKKDSLHKSVEAKLNQGDWTLIYLGTQPETWDDAHAIGMTMGSTAVYQGTRAHSTYTVASRALHSLVSSAESGSRNLFASKHTDRPMAAAAGMTLPPEELPPSQGAPLKPAPKWR